MESNIPIAASRGLRIDISPVPPLVVQGDRRRLEQVFFNLVVNSVKFTPEGGRVSILVSQHSGAVEIAVTDTGAGIPPEFLPHVFDPFRQGDPPGRRGGGVGLGLAIARELVDAHKGSIRVESDGPGRGSTFVVTLPAAEQVSAEAATVHQCIARRRPSARPDTVARPARRRCAPLRGSLAALTRFVRFVSARKRLPRRS